MKSRAEQSRSTRTVLALSVLAGALWPCTLRAQSLYDRSANIAVTSRPHPEYDALGIRLGGFIMYPRVSLSGTFDDNVYGLPSKTSGFITSIAPSLDFASDWTRNSLNVDFRYERDQYVSQSNQSSDEFSLSSNGRLDIDHASAATFTLNLARLVQPRTSPDSFAALQEPVKYDLITTGGSIYREFNRIRLDASISNNYYSFFDAPLIGGGVFPESSRDENVVNESLRASWAFSPSLATFLEVSPNQSYFLHAPTNGFASFDSSGYAATVGVNGQITHLITADAGIGYYAQSYADPRISEQTGLAYNATLHYYPTQLLTVTGRASHSFAAAGIPGTPSSNVDSLDVRADYEVRRFLIVSPELSYVRYGYPGISRTDDRYGASFSATYLVNRYLGVTGSYNYIRQNSNGAFGGIDFDDNRISLTLTLQR